MLAFEVQVGEVHKRLKSFFCRAAVLSVFQLALRMRSVCWRCCMFWFGGGTLACSLECEC